MRKYVIYMCLLIFYSCKEEKRSDLTRLKIDLANPIRNISEFADEVTYIPLEDKPPYFLGKIDKLIVKDDLIIAGDISSRPGIHVYDSSGNFLSSIGSYGEGPGEFNTIEDFSYNPVDKVISVSLPNRIIFFDLDGKYIKENRTKVLYYKHILTPEGQVIFYLPQQIAAEFTSLTYGSGILFKESPETDGVQMLLAHTFRDDVKTPFMLEKNVFSFGEQGELAFSHYFNDTIYIFDRKYDLKKKLLIDLGKYKMSNEHFKKFEKGIDALRNYGDKARIQNDLIYDGKFLSGKLLWREKYYTFLSKLSTQETLVLERFINDIDRGLEYLEVKAVKENSIYSVHRSEEIISKTENNKLNLPDNLEKNLFFIAKYRIQLN